MTQKFSAPARVRKQPEIFCLTFGMRTARSATLLVKGTAWSPMNNRTASGVLPKASWQIVGDGLFDPPARAGRIGRLGIELFALSNDGIVERPEGGDVGGAESDVLLARRLA